MLREFLRYKITVKRPTVTTSNGEQTKTFTTVYTSVPCRYYPTRGSLGRSDVAVEDRGNTFQVILEPKYTDIQIGYKVELSDNDLGNLGSYIVEDVKAQRGNIQAVNHIYLTVRLD